jgi:hypothetical protein
LSGDSENNKERQKKVVHKSVTDYTTSKKYSVTYDDGTTNTHVESKVLLNASRYSRLVDFIINAKIGDTLEKSSTEENTKKEDTSN